MYNLIYDVEELRRFHTLLPELQRDEAYFVSLSARNKYLTTDERNQMSLSRTEMFQRNIVSDPSFEAYIRTLRRMEVNEGGYTTKTHKNIPSKCMVVYANINPVSGKIALKEFMVKAIDLLYNKSEDADKHYPRLNTELMDCYQRARAYKYFIDIDFDIPEENKELLDTFCIELDSNKVEYYIVQTKGGYHLLLKRDTVKYNYVSTLSFLNKEIKEIQKSYEIKVNTNDMIPLPGTIQAGHLVRLIK